MIRNYSEFNTRFRAWHIDKKKLCDISAISISKKAKRIGEVYVITDIINQEEYGEFIHKENLVIMQSIGANDRNERLIYELDVVQTDSDGIGYDEMGVVVYDVDTEGSYMLLKENSIGGFMLHDCEVIGNIFDEEFKDLYSKLAKKLGLE